MQNHKVTDKEKSQWIIQTYFVNIHKINASPQPFPIHILETIEAFIKLN